MINPCFLCHFRFNLNYLHGNNAFRNQESMLWEGCYCPSGTTRLRPDSNVCVASCKQAALKAGKCHLIFILSDLMTFHIFFHN